MFDLTVPSPLSTSVRYAVSSLGTTLTTLGVISESTAQTIIGTVMALLPVVYGVWKQVKMKSTTDAIKQGRIQ